MTPKIGGVPNRKSYEPHPPGELNAWFSTDLVERDSDEALMIGLNQKPNSAASSKLRAIG